MRRFTWILLLPFLLDACATGASPREPSRAPEPSPVVREAEAPSTSGQTLSPASIRIYRSSIPVCYDAALRVFRDRDFQVLKQERGGAHSAALWLRGSSYECVLEFSRTPADRTQVILRLRGCAPSDTPDETARLFHEMADVLLEPRE